MLELHFQNSKKFSKAFFSLLLKQDVMFLKELCEAKNSQITRNKISIMRNEVCNSAPPGLQKHNTETQPNTSGAGFSQNSFAFVVGQKTAPVGFEPRTLRIGTPSPTNWAAC